MTPPPAVQTRRSNWRETVLICRKCSKKAKGGFGPKRRDRLSKALRKALDLAKGRRANIGVVEVGCLDICPKKAVTVALGSDPSLYRIIPAGTPMEAVIKTLDLARHMQHTPDSELGLKPAFAESTPPNDH